MEAFALTALSPLDGRYRETAALMELRDVWSEESLIRKRVTTEIRWLLHLARMSTISPTPLSHGCETYLNSIWKTLGSQEAQEVKEIERTTNHDVKAVEYFIKKRMGKQEFGAHSKAAELTGADWSQLQSLKEYVHFGCTSEDINNIAYALLISDAKVILRKNMTSVLSKLVDLACENAEVPMLSRTHGQPASPTTFGKELANYADRLYRNITTQFDRNLVTAKLNGAVGNFNAFCVAYPDLDWPDISHRFIKELGLEPNTLTTQIEPHDYIAELCDTLCRFNTILLNLNVDIWTYISRELVCLHTQKDEIGSSTMPHKVNPIDFENSEGNIKMAAGLLKALSSCLPVSRMQRDLSDSTCLRNVGTGFGYSLLAYSSCLRGLKKIRANAPMMLDELDDHWEVVAEPVQMILRKYGAVQPYEFIKVLTRGRSRAFQKKCLQLVIVELARGLKMEDKSTSAPGLEIIAALAETEQVDDLISQYCSLVCLGARDKEILQGLCPKSYIGQAAQLARQSAHYRPYTV